MHALFTLFVFVCLYWCPTHIVLCVCFVFVPNTRTWNFSSICHVFFYVEWFEVRDGSWLPTKWFNPTTLLCLSQYQDFQHHMSWCSYMFNGLRLGLVVGIPLAGLIPQHFLGLSKYQELDFQQHMSFFVFNGLRWGMVVLFVVIDWIVYLHCLILSFHNVSLIE